MRVSDELKTCVCFLAIRFPDGSYEYTGTAFFVSVPSVSHSSISHVYIVTAKHCIEKAKETYDNLHVRLNSFPGETDFENEADYVQVPTDWIYPDDEAIDVAIRPFALPQDAVNYLPLHQNMFLTDEKMNAYNVGIGDDVFLMGLFTQHAGKNKNLPIVRSGIIAAMPEEPLEDAKLEKPYTAYLIEIRSIGGLSGCPVFLRINRSLNSSASVEPEHGELLLGLIRGHWDLTKDSILIHFPDDEVDINSGIAIVTPIQEVVSLLYSKELSEERLRQETQWFKDNPTSAPS